MGRRAVRAARRTASPGSPGPRPDRRPAHITEMTAVPKPVVLIAEQLAQSAMDVLGTEFEIRHVDGADRSALLPALADADAVLIRSATTMDAEALAAAPVLKVVARAGHRAGQRRRTGRHRPRRAGGQRPAVEHHHRRRARASRCCSRSPGRSRPPTPRCAPASGSAASSPASSSPTRPSASSVSAGSGSCSPPGWPRFGTTVIAYDPYLQPARAAALGVRLVDLPTLLATADVISIHLPRTPETLGLIGAAELATVKPGVLIVNAARGGLIDEQALADALMSRAGSAGAGIDVYVKEPLPADSPLRTAPNTVLDPAPRGVHRRGAGQGRHRGRQVGQARAARRLRPGRGERAGGRPGVRTSCSRGSRWCPGWAPS